MTQGSDDDASKPSKGTDEGWDDLLGDVPAAPAAPVAPTTPAAPVVPAPVAGRDPQEQPASEGPSASTSSGGSLFAPPSLAGAKVPTPAELDAAEPDDADAQADEAGGESSEDPSPDDRDDAEESDEASADADDDDDAADGALDPTPSDEAETERTDDADAESVADAPASLPDAVDDKATVDAPLAAERTDPAVTTETVDAPPKAADTELPPKTSPAPQKTPKSAEARAKKAPRDDDDVELPPVAAPADDEDGSGWLWIIGLAAVAVVGFFVFRSGVTAYVPAGKVEADAASSEAKDEDPEEAPVERASEKAMEVRENSAADVVEPPDVEGQAEGEGADALEAGDDGSAQGEEVAEGEGSGMGTGTGTGTGETGDSGGDGDPRAVPAGTSEANAAAFSKIPVALSDRAPLVGVGANGIHVDEFDLGSKYEARKCKGADSAFSVKDGHRANACFRVVHHREEDQVTVQWMKDGQLVRRNKVKVPDSHAYKTRASLALREEYVGNWTVQVVSSDDVVLAKGSFTVVE